MNKPTIPASVRIVEAKKLSTGATMAANEVWRRRRGVKYTASAPPLCGLVVKSSLTDALLLPPDNDWSCKCGFHQCSRRGVCAPPKARPTRIMSVRLNYPEFADHSCAVKPLSKYKAGDRVQCRNTGKEYVLTGHGHGQNWEVEGEPGVLAECSIQLMTPQYVSGKIAGYSYDPLPAKDNLEQATPKLKVGDRVRDSTFDNQIFEITERHQSEGWWVGYNKDYGEQGLPSKTLTLVERPAEATAPKFKVGDFVWAKDHDGSQIRGKLINPGAAPKSWDIGFERKHRRNAPESSLTLD